MRQIRACLLVLFASLGLFDPFSTKPLAQDATPRDRVVLTLEQWKEAARVKVQLEKESATLRALVEKQRQESAVKEKACSERVRSERVRCAEIQAAFRCVCPPPNNTALFVCIGISSAAIIGGTLAGFGVGTGACRP